MREVSLETLPNVNINNNNINYNAPVGARSISTFLKQNVAFSTI